MSLDRNQVIKVYATRLVKSLVPKEFGEEFAQSVVYDLLNSLSTTSNKSSQQRQYELSQLTSHYKTSFLSNGLRIEWNNFERVWDALSQMKSVEQLHSYLMFFNALQRETESLAAAGEVGDSNAPEPSTGSDFGNMSPNMSNRSFNNGQPILHSSPYKDSPVSTTMEQLIQPYYDSLPEQTILTYLPYTLLGLDSKLLSFSGDREIELPLNVNSSYSGLLTNVLESGLLYKNCALFVKDYRGKLQSPIKTSFSVQVDIQLNLFANHINQLFVNQPPSLLFVYNNLYAWILELRLLYTLTHKAEQLGGFDFLSHVYELTKYQDLRIQKLSQSIFLQISIPYFEQVENWVINGELASKDSGDEGNDDEFFIKFKVDEPHFNDIIQFIPSKKPFFCNSQTSYKIFQIGKMLIFLTQVCKELSWINSYVNKYSRIIYEQNQGLKSMSISSINELIEMQYSQLLNYFTSVVQGEKNEMYQHLINFKKFYLTQNNDFIDLMIFKGTKILNESSTNISSNYLSKLLIESINESSVRDNRYSPRLDARILDPVHGNIGWEVFTIEYRIEDLPIHTIFENQMMQYLKMFNFLWRLRHLHYVLVDTAVESANLRKIEFTKISQKYAKIRRATSLGIRDRKIVWIVKTSNTVSLIRNNFIKFLNALIGYLSFDVIEHSFDKFITDKLFQHHQSEVDDDGKNSSLQLLNSLNPNFVKSLQTNSILQSGFSIVHNMTELTFDELLKMHEAYLSRVINNKLINENSVGKHTQQSFITQIYQLLEIVFRFIKGSEELNNLLVNYVLIMNIDTSEDEEEYMNTDQDLQDIEGKMQILMKKIYREVYLEEYKSTLAGFVADLKSDFDLKDLSYSFV